MEELQGNPTFSVLFLLVFFGISTWVERFDKKGRIRTVLKKVPWDTLGKVFVYWAAVLVLRKLLYYKPIEGIVQTKDSVWWADTNITYFLCPALLMLMIPLVIVNKSKLKKILKFLKDKHGRLIINLVLVGGVLVFIFIFTGSDYNIGILIVFLLSILAIPAIPLLKVSKSKLKKSLKSLKDKQGSLVINLVLIVLISACTFLLLGSNLSWELIIKSLLPLKVICSGKYLGLLTAVFLAYYIADGNQRLKKITIPIKKRKIQANVFIIPGLFVIFLILTLIRFSEGWDQKFTTKLSEAQLDESVKKFEDLLDAVSPIKNEQYLKKAAVAISKTGDWQWALDTTKAIKDIRIRFEALEQIFVITLRLGNRYESEAVLEEMFDFVKPLDDIDKFRALKEIEQLTFKTGKTTWIIKIIQQEVLAAVRIDDPKERVKALTKIAADIAAMGYENRVKEIFQQAIEQVQNIRNQKDQSLQLKEVAAAIAKTGDTRWAEVVANDIADEEIKNKALEEVREDIEEK